MHKRQLFRMVIARTGWITRSTETVPCQVVNLSESGFRLQTTGSFVPNDVLRLTFALSESELVVCTVQMMYVQPPFFVGVINSISPSASKKGPERLLTQPMSVERCCAY